MLTTPRPCRFLATIGLVSAVTTAALADEPQAPATSETVSFYKQIRPIFQANCQGCHQPAKAGGDYVMTAFDRLLAGGESGVAAIAPGKPDESQLLDQVAPDKDGKALMPQGKPALAAAEIDLIRRWIAQGAADDTPANAVARFDPDHPPVYARPPVIPALDVSPDGALLAIAGFHEVLLWKADGSALVARLIGLAERIESVRFSPDGTRLAVTGGLPGRLGELQVWDVAKHSLLLSLPVSSDTVYGASWSPDGTRIAFGLADNTVRAIDAASGEQVLFMGSHNDWPLDTVFTHDGSHLVSVGRDMAVKLTEVATQRFVDNVTSITPGALKGGVQAVARHPQRDEIVIGGSDGIPKLYRVFRLVTRVIGDDSNIIRQFPAMPGRVNAVAVSPDGKRIAAASSSDGTGQVNVYAYEFDTALPDDIKAIMAKVSTTRSSEENAKLEKYTTDGARLVSSLSLPTTGMYTLAFRPDGVLVAAGADGLVRLIEAETGKVQKEFAPAPAGGTPPEINAPAITASAATESAAQTESLPQGTTLASLEVRPDKLTFGNRFDYAQLVVTGKLANGDTLDVTRLVEPQLSAPIAEVSRTGLVAPKSDGQAVLKLTLAGQSVDVPVSVANLEVDRPADFIHDVNPALSRLGCNAGTCHGSAQGKAGFKLSLRGYDPLFDVRAFTDDLASRRVTPASPDDSLMLLKTTGAVPHVGGQLMKPGESYYELLRTWIASGAKLNLETPRVTGIEVYPVNPVIQQIGARQQLRVVATYADGQTRDVTREAFIESGNTEVAKSEAGAIATSLRRGEAPLLARYEGAYASTTLTVMGDRTGFPWQEPPTYSKIDELVARKWERMKILPSDICTDAEFIRRASLDLTGLPPTADEVRAFLADPAESRRKREALIDRLIGSEAFIDYWTNKWADLLQVNRKFLDVEGAVAFRGWIREHVAKNTPYDQFAKAVVTASGSNRENPAASYFKILREPTATMENTTQLFLAVRFNCNKCHDHPFERWTQDQYYQTAAYFAQIGLENDPESKGRMIGGTAVEGAKPLYEVVKDTGTGEVIHDRTKQVSAPKFPYDAKHETPADASRRQQLAAWLTSADNRYFARSYVNRLWGYLLGVGIIEPLDDIRAGNPPSNPELLDYLTQEFIDSGFNVRHVMRLIATSRTYQLSLATSKWNEDDRSNYSHAIARRLPAEVLLDAVYRVTGTQSKIPGVPPGTRAAALPDVGVELPSGFLNTFGRPVRESACECERSSGLQLGPIMALVSGPTLADAIGDTSNELTRLVSQQPDNAKLVDDLFFRVLNRPATPAEIQGCLESFGQVDQDHQKLAEELARRELEFAMKRPKLEIERSAAIAAAETALATHEQELAPKRAEAEKQKAEKTAALEADLKNYEAAGLTAKLADWEKQQQVQDRWVVLDPSAMRSNRKGVTFEKQPDGSIFVGGDDENGVITVTAETDLKDITGFRLEMIADQRLPNRGPGRASDGNLVLTEFQLTAAPKADPKQAKPVALQTPLADFSQANFDVKEVLDGNPNRQNGWALSPTTGVTHWATFETKESVGHDGGTLLTFNLRHNFGKGFQPGRFRLSVTRLPRPIGLTLPEEYRAIVAVAPEIRTPAQRETLLAYFRKLDGDYRAKVDAVNASKAPLPEDPKLVQLRAALEAAKRPVPVDPALAQLRTDLEQSVQQAATKRLTVAQDIAWALINSPAFLFNH